MRAVPSPFDKLRPQAAGMAGGADASRRWVTELERLRDAPGVEASDLAAALRRLRPLDLSAKNRAAVLAAARDLLHRIHGERLSPPELAGILAGLTPPYLASGATGEIQDILASALPAVGGAAQALDAASAAGILRALAILPLDDDRKRVAADLIVAIAPRLRELATRFGPEDVAGCVQGLRLLRRANRPLMLELLALLLRRGIEAAPWEPAAVVDLCRGLLTVRPDPDALAIAAELLVRSLPGIATRFRELDLGEVADVFNVVGTVPDFDRQVAGDFLLGVLPRLQGRVADLSPAEVASIVWALGHLNLEGSPRKLASAFASRALLSQQPRDFSPFEMARVLTGLGNLDLDGSAAAVAAAFTLAVVDDLRRSGEQLPVRELAAIVGIAGRLPVDAAGADRLRELVEALLPEIRRRAARFSVEEQRLLAAAFRSLGTTGPVVEELEQRWSIPPPAGGEPAGAPASVAAHPPATPGGNPVQREGEAMRTAGEVASDLGISKVGVYRRLRKLGIAPPGPAGFDAALVARLRAGASEAEGAVAPAPPARDNLGLGEAAASLGVHRTALARWLREEKDVAAAIVTEGRRLWITPEAMALLREAHARRTASAPDSLRKAWAARRRGATGSGTEAPATTSGAVPPGSLSGVEAAAALGIGKPWLYEILRRHGIERAPGRRTFTPDVMARIAEAMARGGASTRDVSRAEGPAPASLAAEVPSRQGTARAPASEAPAGAVDGRDEAILRIVGALERITADFRETVERLLEHQRALIDQLRRPRPGKRVARERRPPQAPGNRRRA